jgi:flagellar FliL protein
MTQATLSSAEEPPRKRSRKPLLAGLVLLVLAAGGGFFAVYSGMVLDPHAADGTEEAVHTVAPLPEIAFVALQPLVISLGPDAGGKFLHFTAQVEVEKAHEADVVKILPRIIDVLNTYLRAVGTAELEDPDALVRIRAQMLRRVQLVSGEGRVRDLLVSEFVIN